MEMYNLCLQMIDCNFCRLQNIVSFVKVFAECWWRGRDTHAVSPELCQICCVILQVGRRRDFRDAENWIEVK